MSDKTKLWLLKPIDDLPEDDNPWEPWYDKCFGMVVRAENEELARAHAEANSGDESGMVPWEPSLSHSTPWADAKYSSCTELLADGEEGVLIRDMHHA